MDKTEKDKTGNKIVTKKQLFWGGVGVVAFILGFTAILFKYRGDGEM